MSGNVLIRQHSSSLFSLYDHRLLIRWCQHANFLRAHTPFCPTLFLASRSFPGQIQLFCGNYNPISSVYLGYFATQKDGKKGYHTYEDYKQSYSLLLTVQYACTITVAGIYSVNSL
jgi:hypothetical protein